MLQIFCLYFIVKTQKGRIFQREFLLNPFGFGKDSGNHNFTMAIKVNLLSMDWG